MSSGAETMVGVPFYEGEGQEVLDATLKNIDLCLGALALDAPIVVLVNGPSTAAARPPALDLKRSRYNADVAIINGSKRGLVNAVNDIVELAADRQLDKVFITDADIYRFPDSLKEMWKQADRPLIGAHYRPYPLEVVEAAYGSLSFQERLLYHIFDGDQSPQVRDVLRRYGADRSARVKGSLMLVDVDVARGMHEGQDVITDSVMNRRIALEDSKIAENAYFMHMGRTDMTDHIKARLRHYRGAVARNDLEGFLRNQVTAPNEAAIEEIAEAIRQTVPRGDFYAMLYLTRCALRTRVDEICQDIVTNRWYEAKLYPIHPVGMNEVSTYAKAQAAIDRFLLDVDWEELQGYAIRPPSTTQEELRVPIDLELYLTDRQLGSTILASLGIESQAALRGGA